MRRRRTASHAALDEALPDGLDVLEVVESPGGSLADRLEASRWRLDVSPTPARTAAAAVAAFLATESVAVERMTKKGLREFDCRAAVVVAQRVPRTSAAPASTWCCGTPYPPSGPTTCWPGSRRSPGSTRRAAPLLTRLAQGPLDAATGAIGDPLRACGIGPLSGGVCDTRRG